MWLLDSTTFELISVPSHDPPPYAILSHTWGAPEDEILFDDIRASVKQAKKRASFIKIQYACEQARKDSLEFCWIDTCCIDKRSSAELQESINSMFEWYKKAHICYVYLSDVPNSPTIEEFSAARWFTRGWTLQELIAPKNVVFFSNIWTHIGRKTSDQFISMLNKITNIPSRILNGEASIHSECVANRMSWASKRETSRPEDLAYCLLGIFSIYMPMLYGEGSRAFQRLQEEIIKTSNDFSIFFWRDTRAQISDKHGLLAHDPWPFSASSQKQMLHMPQNNEPFAMTNRGLQIQARLIRVGSRLHFMMLDCAIPNIGIYPVAWQTAGWYGVLLWQLDRNGEDFVRVHIGQLAASAHLPSTFRNIYVKQPVHVAYYTSIAWEKSTLSSIRPCGLHNYVPQSGEALRICPEPLYISNCPPYEYPLHWMPIGWTAEWDFGGWNPNDVGYVYFQNDTSRLIAQMSVLGKNVTRNPRALTTNGFQRYYHGSFNFETDLDFFAMPLNELTEEKDNLKSTPEGLLVSMGTTKQSGGHAARLFFEPFPEVDNFSTDLFKPIFVIQVWSDTDRTGELLQTPPWEVRSFL
jgi:hypothetical protein